LDNGVDEVGKRNRTRRPARHASFKHPKPVILVVTEGEITEPEYLNGFAKAMKNSRVRVEVVGGVGVPKTIVERAKSLKQDAEKKARRQSDENLRYDEVWCVFDVDQHPYIPDAKQMARDNQMQLAISNPCIELWLWLHLAEQPGMQHRHDLLDMIKTHIPNYNKHVKYSEYAPGYENAVRRAKRLDADAESVNEGGRNPTTGVWRLTESIRTHS
jgi:hypothetical protein